MAKQIDREMLERGAAAWNNWRADRPAYSPDLTRENFSKANLRGVDLADAKMAFSNFESANLFGSDLSASDLRQANLSYANLSESDLRDAILIGANLTHAILSYADLRLANLIGANLSDADLTNTEFEGAIIDSVIPAAIIPSLLKCGAILIGSSATHQQSQTKINRSPRFQTYRVTTPLTGFNLSLCSLFVRLPPPDQRRNDFDLAESLSQCQEVHSVSTLPNRVSDLLNALAHFGAPDRIADLTQELTRAISEDYAIVGIRNPIDDLGPSLLGGGFSVAALVTLLHKGTKPKTVMAAVFLMATGIIVIHLAHGIGRGLEKGGEDVTLAVCERLVEMIRRPMETAQLPPEK